MTLKNKVLTLFLLIFSVQSFAQKSKLSWAHAVATGSATLNVQYLKNFPYAYRNENGDLTGVEIDILREFADWSLNQKGVKIKLNFISNKDFYVLYDDIKMREEGIVGSSGITINPERMLDVKFSSPYLQNKSLLISNGVVPTVTGIADLRTTYNNKTAIVVTRSSQEKLVKQLQSSFAPDMKIEYVGSPIELLMKINENPDYVGFVDIVSYWGYLEKNKKSYLKIQPYLQKDEYFGFIFPLRSDWNTAFDEFLESGFGFNLSKKYDDILTKHMSFEVKKQVEYRKIIRD